MPVVEPQVVVDRLRGQDCRKEVRQDLHSAQGSVAADADQSLDAQPFHAVGNFFDRAAIARIDIIARGADDRPAIGGVQFGDRGKERIEPDVRHARIEQAAEAFDKAQHLDFALVRADNGPIDRGVQGRSITASGKYADAFHAFNRGCRRPAE